MSALGWLVIIVLVLKYAALIALSLTPSGRRFCLWVAGRRPMVARREES